MVIYLWGTSHYLAEGVFFSLEDAIRDANAMVGTQITKERLNESDGSDGLPQRWIPDGEVASRLWQIRFYRREVKDEAK